MKNKKNRGRNAAFRHLSLLFLSFLASGILLTGCGSQPVMISIAGKVFPLNGKLQEGIDNGLITTDVGGNEEELTETLEAHTVSFTSYWLGNSTYPNKCPVTVTCYNPGSSEQSVYECKVMTVNYFVKLDNEDQAQVLLSGIDFWGMTEDEALAALEAVGIKGVDYDLMHESHFNVCKKGDVVWTIHSEKGNSFHAESQDPQKTVVDFDSDTYYISEVSVDISSTLRIKF